MRLGILAIVILCAVSMGIIWGAPADSSSFTKQDPLQQLWQKVDYLERRVDRLNDDMSNIYSWAKKCEERIITGEKREAELERRVRTLEGRLYGEVE